MSPDKSPQNRRKLQYDAPQREATLNGHKEWSILEAGSLGIPHTVKVPVITDDEHDVSLKGLVVATKKRALTMRVNPSEVRDVSTYAMHPETVLKLLPDDHLRQTLQSMGIPAEPTQMITTWIQGGKIGDIFHTQLLNGTQVAGEFITYADHFPSDVQTERSVKNDFERLNEMSKRSRSMSGIARLAGTSNPASILSFPTPYVFRGKEQGALYDSFSMSHIDPDTAEEFNVFHQEIIEPKTQISRCSLLPIYSFPIGERGNATLMEQINLARDVQEYCEKGGNIQTDAYPFSNIRTQFFDIAKAYAMLLFYGKGTLPLDIQINSGDLMAQIIPNSEGVGVRNIHLITIRGEKVRIGGKPEFIHALRNAVAAAPISFNGKRLVCSTFSILTDEDLQLAYDSVWGMLPEKEKKSLIPLIQSASLYSELDYWDASQTKECVLTGRVMVPSLFQTE